MKPLKPSDYLDHPERAVALFNRVIGSGGDLATVQQALHILTLSLRRAGFKRLGPDAVIREPSAPPKRCGH